ncbi:MAG: U32 family peptidase [Candidatus Helarchaeota archaeon]
MEVFVIQLTVATNWDPELIEKLAKYPVRDLYGSAPNTPIGGGRPSFLLPQVSEEQIAEYINEVHKHKLKFAYLLNAPCLGNMEYDRNYYRKIIEYLQWIVDIGSDYVIVTIPFLIQIIHEQFPQLKIRVSTISFVNSVNRAKFYAQLGANEITPDVMINRDFKTLEKMQKALKKYNCELNLLLTDGCLFQCPFRYYHYNLTGHSSQSEHPLEGKYIDTCVLNCSIIKYSDPVELIKCRWVRPEDIVHYEDIGIKYFKIAGRRMPTNWIIRSVDAYSNRKYDGNLIDIIQAISISAEGTYKTDPFERMRECWDMEQKAKVIIDNTKLDGFIEFFKKQNCNAMCDECNYCAEWAKRAIIIDESRTKPYVSALKNYMLDIISGREFGLEPKGESKKIEEKVGLKWDPRIKEIFDQIILETPDHFKEIARIAISSMAEQKAKARNSNIVEDIDMIEAFLEGTPGPFQNDMRNSLKKFGFNIDE